MNSPPILVSSLPRTSNALAQHERQRLMRSTRKLGAVLGTTPLVLEPVTELDDEHAQGHPLRSPTRSHSLSKAIRSQSKPREPLRRQNSLSISSPPLSRTSTSSSEVDSVPSSPVKLTKVPRRPPQQITLYLNTALAASESPDPSCLCPPRSPSLISLLATAPPSPTLSIVPTPAPDVVRRRKMAKLQRTLGENIPVELVFRDTTPRRPPPANRPKVSSPPGPQLVVTTTTASASPVYPPPAFLPVFPQRQASRRPGSAAPFSERRVHVKYDIGSENPAKIKAKDWSGEWNVGDIRKVQQGLRALKKA